MNKQLSASCFLFYVFSLVTISGEILFNDNEQEPKQYEKWKNMENIKNTNWKLIWIDNTIVKLEKKILCKLQTTSNGDPIEIAVNFNVILMHDKIKENYMIW